MISEDRQRALQEEKLHRIVEQPVGGLICRLAVPTIITMLISSLYNLVDTYFVSKLSDGAVAAVGIVYSLVCFTQAVGYYFGQGSGNYISRALGSGDSHDAREMAEIGFSYSFLCGTLIAVAGLIFLTPLCRILGAPAEILTETKTYCSIILLGTPFIVSSLTLNCQYRFQGNAFSSMLGICVGAVLNVILDPIFILPWGFGLEIAGAAWATVLSQVVGFFVLFFQSKTRGNIPLRIRVPKMTRAHFRHINAGGLPSLFRQGFASVSLAVLNLVAKPFGIGIVAAMSVVSRIMNTAVALPTGLGQGFQPVCGMNYGARQYRRVRKAFRFTVLLALGVCVVCAATGLIFSEQLISVFRGQNSGSEVLTYGVPALCYQCLTYPLLAFLILTNMMVQTMGKAFSGTFLAVARTGLFFIPAVLLLSHFLGRTGILFAQPCSDLLAFVCALAVWIRTDRELRRPDLPLHG